MSSKDNSEKNGTSSWEGFNRRKFIGSAMLIGAGAALQSKEAFSHDIASDDKDATKFSEDGRKLTRHQDFDVIVCGGGPAGIAAAITAARAGARVQLLEIHGCLGGVWTAGLLTWIFDFDRPGINHEVARNLEAMGGKRQTNMKNFTYSPEVMKRVLEKMCAEAGVNFLLHYQVAAAYKKKNRINTIITESKSGREAWGAKVFIDCTGDGDVGALVGNGWDIGQGGETCPCQPLTLNALTMVKDVDALKPFLSFYNDGKGHVGETDHHEADVAFRKEINRAGMDPSYTNPTLFPIKDNLVMIMVNHEYNIKAYDAPAVSEATVRAREEVNKIVDGLNKLGGPWEGMQVVATAEHIGIRDGRRIHGRYTVRKEDLISGTMHDDGVVVPTFNVDIHALSAKVGQSEALSHGDFKMKPYDIPLRALIAKDVDGLMMAGRCISGDFYAHASYRVTGDAVAMGQAAGAVAAIAATSNRMPHEVSWSEGEAMLKKLGQMY